MEHLNIFNITPVKRNDERFSTVDEGNRTNLESWLSKSWETKSPVYTVQAKPVSTVFVRVGMDSRAARARA